MRGVLEARLATAAATCARDSCAEKKHSHCFAGGKVAEMSQKIRRGTCTCERLMCRLSRGLPTCSPFRMFHHDQHGQLAPTAPLLPFSLEIPTKHAARVQRLEVCAFLCAFVLVHVRAFVRACAIACVRARVCVIACARVCL
eukprot:2426848-Pleurochrysis_carterae.AAC.3